MPKKNVFLCLHFLVVVRGDVLSRKKGRDHASAWHFSDPLTSVLPIRSACSVVDESATMGMSRVSPTMGLVR